MSCHFQKLFGTDGELEDEDFLSAVEDAENQFVIPGHSSHSAVPVPPSKSNPSKSHPSSPHPSSPHPSKAPTLRPLSGPPVGFPGPPSRGAAAQDELDNDLFLAACRELEPPQVPPWRCPGKENAQEGGIPKKLRVGEELVPGSGGLQDRQGPLPSPKLVLRPSTAGACAPRAPPAMGEPGHPGGSVPARGGSVPAPGGSVPARGGSVPARGGSVPAPGGSVPAPGGSVLARGGSVPAPGGSVPAPGGSVPTPGGSVPTPGGSVPAPGGSVPARGGSVPAPGGSVPARGGSVPARGGSVPAPGGSVPAPGGSVPARGGFVPAPGGSVPAPGGSVPARGGSVPAPGGSVPARGGSVPAPGGSVPAPGGSVPAPGGSVPAPGGSVPALGALRPGQAPLGRSSSSVPWTPPAQSCPQPRQPPRPPSGPPSSVEAPRPLLRQPPGPPNPPPAPNAPGPPNPPVVTNHLVQLVTAASKAPGGPPRAPQRRESRRFPGPAGILPQQHSGKLLDEILVSAPQTPAHGAVAKPRAQALPSSPLPTEEDFGKGPWLAMKTELGLDERDPSCFLHTYSVVMVLRKAALKQLPKNKVPSMAVMIKTLTRSSAGAGAVFRDPTGEMQGTVHRLLLEQRQSELRAGSVLLLRQVGVFSPSHRNHYLNVTPNNLLRIFLPEPEGCSPRQVPAQAELTPDPPVQPPQGVPVPEDRGQSGTGGHSPEQHPGGSSLCPPSSDPSREEPLGAEGCDVDDLDGLLGELPEDFFSAPAQADCG